MKLLYYSSHPQLSIDAPTGYGTHMREMVDAWRKMGVEVKTLIAADLYKGGGPAEVPIKGRLQILRRLKGLIPKVLWESLKDLTIMRFDRAMKAELKQAIADFGPDLIYERVAYLQSSGTEVAQALGVPLIVEVNAPYVEERQYFSGRSWLLSIAKSRLRNVLSNAHCIATVSTALAKHLESIVPEASAKMIVLPNAVNPSEVVHGREQIEAIRSELQLGESLIFGFVGSIFPYHGVDLLIDAFAGLPDSLDAKLLIVGDGASLPELKAQAIRSKLHTQVIFTGSVPHRDVYLYIELMDVCCMARSNWYGSPVKLFEYGLLKKAVIAPDVSPVRDVMDETTAILVQPEVDSVKEAMQELHYNASLRRSLAEAWHRKVLMEHTWSNAAQIVLDRCI